MKRLIHILESNGTGVLRGNFRSNISFEGIFRRLEIKSKRKFEFKFSLGREFIGHLIVPINEIKLLERDTIVIPNRSFDFKTRVLKMNCSFFLTFHRNKENFGEFWAIKN